MKKSDKSSILQFLRYYHNTRPENVEAYRQKVCQQEINLKDERKVQIVCILACVAVAEYILATIIYRYLCKKM